MNEKKDSVNNEKKDKHVGVRMTAAEFSELKKLAEKVGLKPSTFLRNIGLGFDLPAPIFDRKIIAALGKIGGNLNQIARRLNVGDQVSSTEILKYVAEGSNAARDVRDILNKS